MDYLDTNGDGDIDYKAWNSSWILMAHSSFLYHCLVSSNNNNCYRSVLLNNTYILSYFYYMYCDAFLQPISFEFTCQPSINILSHPFSTFVITMRTFMHVSWCLSFRTYVQEFATGRDSFVQARRMSRRGTSASIASASGRKSSESLVQCSFLYSFDMSLR